VVKSKPVNDRSSDFQKMVWAKDRGNSYRKQPEERQSQKGEGLLQEPGFTKTAGRKIRSETGTWKPAR
jgi:hypothetical protein